MRLLLSTTAQRSLGLSLAVCLLVACVASDPAPIVDGPAVESSEQAVQRWLLLHGEVAATDSDEAVEKLVTLERPENEEALYYFALLNQRLESYGAWVLARDAFSELEASEALFPAQRQLAFIMRQHNQGRINSYLRIRDLVKSNAQLQEQQRTTEQDRLQLQQKIETLTELEADISTRREE